MSQSDGGQDSGFVDDAYVTDVAVTTDATADAPVKQPYDGTTGKACTTDSDCASANGPNVARCSNSVFAPQDYYPTAVCMLPTCSVISDSTSLHFCDGPDNPSSPGICVPDGSSMTGGACIPKCSYDMAGSAPTGCQGHDTCFAFTLTKESGIGYCWGGCTKDSDCQNNQKCQTDQGLCALGVTPPTKTIGAACTSADSNAGVCNCLYGSAKTGYCSSFCEVGGTTCPVNMVCDSLEARGYGYTTPNTGMAGYCAFTCTLDGGSCPSSSVCTDIFASGPDCIAP